MIVAAELMPLAVFDTRESCNAAADELPAEATAMCVAWLNN